MRSYESFSSQVEDDRSPACALNVTGQGVRDFNHRSIGRVEAGRLGWQFPADACQALGELRYLADGLPQSFEQIIRALRGQLEQGHIKIDPGTEWEGNPAGAVEAVSVALNGYAGASSAVVYCRTSCYTHPMTKTIAQRELRNENAKVIEAVAAGETFVVTRNGEPVAELRPLLAGRRTFISREEVAALASVGVRIDRHQFRADIDHLIDQGL